MNQNTYKIDINEIVFIGKNKEYGAYLLRKKYKTYLSIATLISVTIFLLAVASPLLYKYFQAKEEIQVNKKKSILITELAEPPSIGEKKEIQQVEAPPPLKSTIKFLPPVVKPDDQVTDEYIPTAEELHEVDPGTATQVGQAGGVDYSLLEVEEPVEEVVKEKKEEAFTYVEEMPSFPGGDDQLLKFIASNVKYPEIARRAGVEGKVYVSFVVEKNGNITELQVVKGIGAGCDEEALRVIQLMDKWKPGRQNGNPVRVRISIPFLFRLNS